MMTSLFGPTPASAAASPDTPDGLADLFGDLPADRPKPKAPRTRRSRTTSKAVVPSADGPGVADEPAFSPGSPTLLDYMGAASGQTPVAALAGPVGSDEPWAIEVQELTLGPVPAEVVPMADEAGPGTVMPSPDDGPCQALQLPASDMPPVPLVLVGEAAPADAPEPGAGLGVSGDYVLPEGSDPQALSELMTAREVAQLFGRSLRTLNNWDRQGVLRPCCRIRGQRYYRRSDVYALCDDIMGHIIGECQDGNYQ